MIYDIGICILGCGTTKLEMQPQCKFEQLYNLLELKIIRLISGKELLRSCYVVRNQCTWMCIGLNVGIHVRLMTDNNMTRNGLFTL